MALLGQRILGLALGYEDVNDHDELRRDRALSTAMGRVECGVCAFGLRAVGRQKHAEPDGAVGERAGPGESAPDHRGFRCARRAARGAVPGVGRAGPDAEAAGAGYRCHGRGTARPAGAPVLSRVLPCILLPSAAGVLQRLAGADGTAHVEQRCGGGRGGDGRAARGPAAEELCQEFSAISGGSGDPPIWAGLRSAQNFRAFHAASCHVSDSGSDARTTPIRPYR